MGFFGRNLFNLIFGLVGAIFLVIGIPFTWVGSSLSREATQTEALPVLTVASLQNSSVGRQAVLEGRLSERNPLLFQSFVAYIRREYRGEHCERVDDDDNFDDNDYRCEAIWVEDQRMTPALWLDLADGRVQLINTNYYIQHAPLTLQLPDLLIENETKSYHGFKIGNPVFVKGRVSSHAEGPAFEADFLYGGDRVSYLSNQRVGANLFFWLGLIFSSIGGLLLLFLLVRWIVRAFGR
jgi:hypothetical protein